MIQIDMPMPESCLFCPFHTLDCITDEYRCIYKDVVVEDYMEKRPDWCPLREVRA